MNVKQEFLKLAGLGDAALVIEAEEQKAVEFAKNSTEVAVVKLAVRKAIHKCEKDAAEVRSPNLRRTYERDAEDYDSILGLVAAGKQSAAAKAWAHMDTAARDVVFEVTTDKEARKLVAAYFGTTLLRENDEESADENDVAVDKDIEQLKKDVAQLKKDQEKDVDDEGRKDAEDTKVTATIKKIESAVEDLEKAQEKDDEKEEEEVEEAVNHMGDREYQTYAGWKTACKKAYPGCGFRGDKDIGAATLDGKDVGEWDGAVGSVYVKQPIKESDDLSSVSDAELMSMAEKEGLEKAIVKDGEGGLANREELIKALSGVSESADVPKVDVADFKDALPDDKEDKTEKAKIPAEVTKAVKDKIKELEAEIKYTSHLPSQEQEIINMNGAIQVMANILELMDKGCEYSMKKISILLTSLEGPQKVLIPKEVWKFMSFDYANPVSKSNLMDKFREVKAHATKTKD